VSEQWIEGRFEGTYAGSRVTVGPVMRGAKRFRFELQSGVVHGAAPIGAPAPDRDGDDERGEIRQPRLADVALEPDWESGVAQTATLFDVRIADFRLRHPAEIKGHALGTVEGTIRARLTPPQPATTPAAPGPESKKTPLAPRPGKRPRARRSAHVTGPETDTVYARTRFWIVIFLLAFGALGLALACGLQTAGIWVGPPFAALVARRALQRFGLRGALLANGLGLVLLGTQAFWLFAPAEVGWQLGCRAPIRADLVWIALPVVATALIRRRWPVVLTASIWTAVMCTWCAQLDGTCTSAVPSAATQAPAPAPAPPPRTDADGRWPAMPRSWLPDLPALPDLRGLTGLTGSGGASGAGAEVELRIDHDGGAGQPEDAIGPQGPGSLSVRLQPGGAQRGLEGEVEIPASPGPLVMNPSGLPDGGASGSPRDGVATLREGGESDAPPQSEPNRPVRALPGDRVASPPAASPAASTRGPASTSTDGGWVAPDHRRTEREGVLISVEHANRMPDSFFSSGGSRRVYLPTDPIFEDGGSRLRGEGALELGRLAALLSSRPAQRVAVEVHTCTPTPAARPKPSRVSAIAVRPAFAIGCWIADTSRPDKSRYAASAARTRSSHPMEAVQPSSRIAASRSG
jgi:hypothetical protein